MRPLDPIRIQHTHGIVRQVLDDPAGDRDWAITAEVDLAASDEQGSPAVWLTGVEALGGL